MKTRKAYQLDVPDDEWALEAPYLALLPEEAGQRRHQDRAEVTRLAGAVQEVTAHSVKIP